MARMPDSIRVRVDIEPDLSELAAHLARVTDAAREQGRREGWTQAWAAGARADEDAYRRGWEDAVADATLAAGDDATPEDAKPAGDEVSRFSGDPCRTFIFEGATAGPRVLNWIDPGFARVLVGFSTCGFACRCATIPSAWVPGSVTR